MSAMSMDFAPWWAEALLRASVQGGLIILLAGIVMRLWPGPGLPAWVRVWVWRVILVKMILAVVLPVSVDVPVKIAAPGVVQGAASSANVLPQVIVWLSVAGLAAIAVMLEQIRRVPSVERILLFGSRARGDHDERSDIDLAVACPTADDDDWARIWLIVDDAPTLLAVDLVRLEHAGDALRGQIEREGLVLYERR